MLWYHASGVLRTVAALLPPRTPSQTNVIKINSFSSSINNAMLSAQSRLGPHFKKGFYFILTTNSFSATGSSSLEAL